MRRRFFIAALLLAVAAILPDAVTRGEFQTPSQRIRGFVHGVVGRVIGTFFDKGGAIYNLRAYDLLWGSVCGPGGGTVATVAADGAMSAALAAATAGGGGTVIVPSGCNPVFTSSITVPANVIVRGESGAILHPAYMVCGTGSTTDSGSSAVGAGCTSDAMCGSGKCLGVGTFAPTASTRYDLIKAASSATYMGLANLKIDKHQLSTTGRCTAGTHTDYPCTTTTATVCTTCGEALSPSGKGDINTVDFDNGNTAQYGHIERVHVLNSVRAKWDFAIGGFSRIERCTNDRQTVTQTGGTTTYAIDFGIYAYGYETKTRFNKITATLFGIASVTGVNAGANVHIDHNYTYSTATQGTNSTGIFLADGWFHDIASNEVTKNANGSVFAYPIYLMPGATDVELHSNVLHYQSAPMVIQGAGIRFHHNYLNGNGDILTLGGDDTSNAKRCADGTKKYYPCTVDGDCPSGSSGTCHAKAAGMQHCQVDNNELAQGNNNGIVVRVATPKRRCTTGGSAHLVLKSCTADADCGGAAGSCFATPEPLTDSSLTDNDLLDFVNGSTVTGFDASGIDSGQTLTNLVIRNAADSCDTPYKWPASYQSTITNMKFWYQGSVATWDSRYGTQTPVTIPLGGMFGISTNGNGCGNDNDNRFSWDAYNCGTSAPGYGWQMPIAATITEWYCTQPVDTTCHVYPEFFDGTALRNMGGLLHGSSGGDCTGSGAPFTCCTGSGTGTCATAVSSTGLTLNWAANTSAYFRAREVLNSDCTGTTTPYPCCTGSGTGNCSTAKTCGTTTQYNCWFKYTIP